MAPKEAFPILQYFIRADKDKDGFIDKVEWVEFSKEIGLSQRVKKKPK